MNGAWLLLLLEAEGQVLLRERPPLLRDGLHARGVPAGDRDGLRLAGVVELERDLDRAGRPAAVDVAAHRDDRGIRRRRRGFRRGRIALRLRRRRRLLLRAGGGDTARRFLDLGLRTIVG